MKKRTPWLRRKRHGAKTYEGCSYGSCIRDLDIEDRGRSPDVDKQEDIGKLVEDGDEDVGKLKAEGKEGVVL